MAKLDEGFSVNISLKWLIQLVTGAVIVTAFYFQVTGTLNNHNDRLTQMHEEIVGIQARLEQMEAEHVKELEHHNEELQQENKSLLERFGLKKR